MNRRDVIKIMGAGATVAFASRGPTAWAMARTNSMPGKISNSPLGDDLAMVSPVDRTIGRQAPRRFSGDSDPGPAHRVLWDKESYVKSIGGLPAPSEQVDVVVIGGGMSGLLSTYFLRKWNVVLLEQGSRFGGNSRGESWEGLDYPLGASYFAVPEKDSAIDRFLHEVNVSEKIHVHTDEDPIFIDGKRYSDYWENGTEAANKHQFVKLAQHFSDMYKGKNGLTAPNIPPMAFAERRLAENLDAVTMKAYIEKFLGAPMHPHLEHVIEYYYWSAAACSASEISAAVGLNFITSDMNSMAVTPGGNSAVAEATFKKIRCEVPAANLRPASLAFDVRTAPGGVHVSYVDSAGRAKTLKAKFAVMSCPKFIVSKILHGIESERSSVIQDLSYRSYLLANVLVEQHLKDSFYDVYFMEQSVMNKKDVHAKALAQKATDMTYANISTPHPSRVVLTAYRGLPFDGARQSIYKPEAYERFRAEFESQIYQQFLPLLGVKKENVVDLRITRWGHPLPLAKAGQISGKMIDAIRKPFNDRVYFVEQDNWMTPAFEVAFGEAMYWTTVVQKQLEASTEIRQHPSAAQTLSLTC